MKETETTTTVLTPQQIAKRQHWAQVLLDNAANRTSYLLAERLVSDWFGEGYDEALSQAKARVTHEDSPATKRHRTRNMGNVPND